MASVVNRPNGRREVQFSDADGKRKTVRLGKMPKRDAESVKIRIEHLLTAQITKRPLEADTARWVATLDEVLADRLAKVGLIRQRESAFLNEYLEGYIAGRTDVKPRTLLKYEAAKAHLIEFFTAGRNLRDITAGDADDWRVFLLRKKLGENTVRKYSQIAKQFFNGAVRRMLIETNPFADLKSTVQGNAERFYFVSRDEATEVLNACPDAEWRLIFGLARFGGLRCPSEVLALTWDCVDWSNSRIRIPSPKTEHYASGSSRTIPLFPELLPLLNDVWDSLEDEPGEFVITLYRDTNANLRTQLKRVIERAGLEPWPKLFQNLRSTRETELAEQYPIHVVCAWIGNSAAVAAKHYLQTTDEHFLKAAQNPTQTAHDKGDSDGPASGEKAKTSEKSHHGNGGQPLCEEKVGLERLELPTKGL